MNIRALINKEESYDVEFKESISGLKSEDLVAFANSDKGGIILIGVKEDRTLGGRQKGQVIGTKITDGLKLSILDKAQSCRPAVNVQISVEEVDGAYIYKIHITSGTSKPYCTYSGIYKTRGDGRNRALYPTELLELFMEQEKNKFISNFRESTRDLEDILKETKKGMLEELKSMESSIEDSLKGIYSSASSAEDSSSSVERTVDNIWKILSGSLYLLPRSESKINDLLNSLNVVNSYENIKTNYLEESLLNTYKKTLHNQKMKEHLYNERKLALKKLFPGMSEEDLKLLYEKTLYQDESINFV